MIHRFRDMAHSLFSRNVWALLLLFASLVAVVNVFTDRRVDVSEFVAKRFSGKMNKRFMMLERYMEQASSSPSGEWLELKDFPEDMVIYRYEGDTLQSWANQFSLDNDDIGTRLFLHRFMNLRYNFISPLAEADTSVKYMNIGPKWYLVKAVAAGQGRRIIGGLEVRNSEDARTLNGVNPRFRLSDRFSVFPISCSGGEVISVEGCPVIKLIQETAVVMPVRIDATLVWLSLIFCIAAVLAYLHFHRNLRTMFTAMGIITLAISIVFMMGDRMMGSSELFSPAVYASGTVLYSLGAVIIINVWLSAMAYAVYMTRRKIFRSAMSGKWQSGLTVAVTFAGLVLLLLYMTFSMRSLMLNSSISLELYRLVQFGRFTLYVYLSYLLLLLAAALLIQVARAGVYRLTGRKYNVLSAGGRLVFSLFCGLYLLAMFSVSGAEKENSRVEIWMNRLSIDRNLGLELQLRSVENAIAADNSIMEIMDATRDYKVILGRITETYMSRISKEYDIDLYLYRENMSDPQVVKYFNERVVGAVQIAPDSRFVYSRSDRGMARYTGLFVYYAPGKGTMKMLLGINSRGDREERGYSLILDSGSPEAVLLPRVFSYAKYINGKLVSYKGDYPYPTVLAGEFRADNVPGELYRQTSGQYVHFFKRISPDECVVVTRQKISIGQYVMAACMICLVAYSLISLAGLFRGPRNRAGKNYYKSRVNAVLFFSMFLTLVTMSIIMLAFIYKRNEANMMNLMTGKITVIQSLMTNRVRLQASYKDMAGQEMTAVIGDIGNYTGSDISLYSPGGKLFNTTAPEVFERMIMGSRTNSEAYGNIMYGNKRYYIHRERVAGRSFYAMYAPLFNDKGTLLAILCAPYTDSGLSFKTDAISHSVAVVAIFIILLIFTRIFTVRIVDKMFRPITEMGRKMLYARTEGLEYIIYDKDDELSGLVRAYNLMVHDLSESGKQVAQAERERAWSEMARQVAHEIKNPLTPMKLQIQRLIRLKSKNDPMWEEKFEDISRLILDSINVLTDTANEFSTFAKLYTEEMVPINLDGMASDQVSMFDDKDNVTFEYFGLKDTWITGPKPQLVRVFVNLLTNAVQAIENQQSEDSEAGLEPVHGQIILSVRNSTREGFYDIVVEDNGPGIKDENRERLFTPNFTTKSSGTGLGLAICKNILERCGGEISYSRSFSLKGACFTVRYPKGERPTSA